MFIHFVCVHCVLIMQILVKKNIIYDKTFLSIFQSNYLTCLY
ncbi:hypothetical protein MtrunA17_Chr5g0437191 [Medicago truncatula]|uniref:Transmembrane protein n=1 Tax=Medicago truncatula TaxID=3880 RepID=A0A396HUW7_MEDTR|nr:hypothetical protein MtrunA17_Chr5g0437191 [Medicago truncatula]